MHANRDGKSDLALPNPASRSVSVATAMKTLSIILIGFLLHPQPAFAAGCDFPMFAGARLFGAAASGGIEFMATGISTTTVFSTW